MGGDNNKSNRWKQGFDNAKKRAAYAPKNAAHRVAQSVKDKAETAGTTAKNNFVDPVVDGVKNVNRKVRNAADNVSAFSKAKGIKGKAAFVGNKAAQKFKGYDLYRKMKDAFLKIQQGASWIAAHAYPIAITTAIVVLLYTLVIFAISLVQAATPTPHYYCDTEADSSLKKTAVYQQYCEGGGNFELENLNGHYIVQDGSGPCYCCAAANMMMRYFTLHDVNFFDYLWDDTGMYSPEGQTVNLSGVGSFQLRKVITHNNPGVTNASRYRCNSGLANGAKAFASKNGIGGWTMANWCYLRDESLDLASYEETDDYYSSNADSDKWVFDLSIGNVAPYSTWDFGGNGVVSIGDVTCTITGCSGGTGTQLKELFTDPSVYGDAGVLVYFDYTGDGSGDHAILITGYDESTGMWRIIDSAKGLNGGYEGPMDGSGNFCWSAKEQGLIDLFNSGQNAYGGYSIAAMNWCVAN